MKTSQLFYAAVACCALIAIGNANEASKAAKPIEAKSEAAKLDDKADVSDAKAKRRRSKVALKRVQAGCTPISTSAGDQAISEETPIDNSVGALSAGMTVCNSRGSTAEIEIDETGEVIATKVAMASPSDLARYRESFDAIVGNINAGNGITPSQAIAPQPPATQPQPIQPQPIVPQPQPIQPQPPVIQPQPLPQASPVIPPMPLAPPAQPNQSET
jgi:hypothetical protein